MKTKCVLVQHVCRWSFYIQCYIILVGRIDFGTNIYLLQSSVHLPSLSGLSAHASLAFGGNTCLCHHRSDCHVLFFLLWRQPESSLLIWLKHVEIQELLGTRQTERHRDACSAKAKSGASSRRRSLPGRWRPAKRKWQEGWDMTFLTSSKHRFYRWNARCVATITFLLVVVLKNKKTVQLIPNSCADL